MDTAVRRRIIELGEGIPLLLNMLAETAIAAGADAAHLPEVLEGAHEQRVLYVTRHYLERLRARASDTEDSRLWVEYDLTVCGAVPRAVSSPELLYALLCDLDGTQRRYTAATNCEDLYQRLARQPFVDTTARGLVYHALVREGVLDYLEHDMPSRLRELHRRAAAWYGANTATADQLYHRANEDYSTALAALRQAIEDALAQGDLPQMQSLIEAAEGLRLIAEDATWIELYKAELAWAESNQALAERRVQGLLRQNLSNAQSERLAHRMEAWFGFSGQGESERVAASQLIYFVWWARASGREEAEAAGALRLGEVARMQGQYEAARAHCQRALELHMASDNRLGMAVAEWDLGEVALMQGQYEAARAHYQRALELYTVSDNRLGHGRGRGGPWACGAHARSV